MAASRFLSLSRTLFASTTTKQTLTSLLLLSRPATTTSLLHPLASASASASLLRPRASSPLTTLRSFCTHQAEEKSSTNNPPPDQPDDEEIKLEGCDFKHWLVIFDGPPENATTRDEIIDFYIKTLAKVVGSEEEARKKLYSVSTKHYYAFGALVSQDLTAELEKVPNVTWVVPDSYLDVKNKDYGGEPFIDGEAVPYDPKYHAEWVKNNAKVQQRSPTSDDRPRNDRSNRRQQSNNSGAMPPRNGGQGNPDHN